MELKIGTRKPGTLSEICHNRTPKWGHVEREPFPCTRHKVGNCLPSLISDAWEGPTI